MCRSNPRFKRMGHAFGVGQRPKLGVRPTK
jgi:hypothetical protein